MTLPCVLVAPPAAGQVDLVGGGYPPLRYYSVFSRLQEGDFASALEGFQEAARDGLRSTEGAWVDAICYRTMIGECFYRLGNLPAAVENYNAALLLFLTYPDWMVRVEFPAGVLPSNRQLRYPPTWSTGQRVVRLGDVPRRFKILFGNVNNEDVIRRGGVFAPPQYHAVDAAEIARCTALALRRRWELLGPVCQYDPLTAKLAAAYQARLGPPNHWSQAWLNVQRGFALAGGGKFAEAAQALQAGVLLAGQFDHPLTSQALWGLGALAQADGQFPAASGFYLESSLSAAFLEQPEQVEEAFLGASDVHLSVGDQQVLAALDPALAWAQRARLPHLVGALATLSAENFVSLRQPAAAGTMLTRARAAVGRRNSLAAHFLARLEFAGANAFYQQANLVGAEAALAASMARQRAISPWLYQVAVTSAGYRARSGQLSARAASDLYEQLLREPTAADWTQRPVDTFCYLLTPHQPAHEDWFAIALERGEVEKALEISDRRRRRRFHGQLPLGGRLLGLRWVLAAPEMLLDNQLLERRNDLLTRYPALRQAADAMVQAQRALEALPVVPDNEEQQQQQAAIAAQLNAASLQAESLLGELALRREAWPTVFPPLIATGTLQESLAPNQLALVYVSTAQGIYAFMLSRQEYAIWQVPRPANLRRDLARLFTALGMVGDNKTVNPAQLASDDWQVAGQQVLASLIDRRQWGFWEKFDELLIVPDGILWYMPFEALPIEEAGEIVPLISKMRIRYAPTASLLAQKRRPLPLRPRTAVVAGQLFPRDDAAHVRAQIAHMQEVIAGLEVLPERLPADSGVLRATWDRLLVLDDIPDARRGPWDWSPGRLDEGRSGGSLARWLQLPWGAPAQVLLPGFHTATESSLRRAGTGDEVFLAATALMASGVQTIVLARWRTGGLSSYDLMREFLQELPATSAAEAWQRAMRVLWQGEIDPAWEPRVAQRRDAAPISSAHPFFWAGYMLLDLAAETPPADDAAAALEAAPPPVPPPPAPQLDGAAPPPAAAGDPPTDPPTEGVLP